MHPIIFESNLFTLHTLWIFISIAILASTYSLIKLAVKAKLKIKFLSDHSPALFLSALVSARLIFVIFNFQFFFYDFGIQNFLKVFQVWDNGLSFTGGVIGFIAYLYYICKKNDQDFWKWLDVFTPATIIGMAIFHLGAFFDGINYGNETGLPWGVNFENPAIKYAVPIHPTQIYAALYSGLIAYILIYLMQHNKRIIELKNNGFIALAGIASYNLFRFLEEFIRGDDVISFFGIRLNFITCLFIIIASGVLLKRRFK